MKLFQSILILFILNPFFSIAQEEANLEFTHGPYLQNVTETSATIMFTTNKLVVPGVMVKSGNQDI